MDGYLRNHFGKLGFGMLRYSPAEIVAVVDSEHAGADLPALIGIQRRAPIVRSCKEAKELGADALVLGVAPPGGRLPQHWRDEILAALSLGMLVVNPLHESLSEMVPERAPSTGRIWDVRVEPPGLETASGKALSLSCARVLTVGTDMAVGKMTAALEMTFAARRMGVTAEFVATGQTGICIWGSGVAVDAVRLDFAPGAVERETLRAAETGAEVLFVEGQGAINHPAASAVLAIMRGCMPTHLVLCARAQQESLWRFPDLSIPPLRSLMEVYEVMATGGGAFPRPRTIGIALDTHDLGEVEAREAVERLETEVGLPVVDPVRYGATRLVETLKSRSKHLGTLNT